jgi:predicted CXXCH cytochrome family protein
MTRRPCALALVLLLPFGRPAAAAEFTGSAACAACHAQAYGDWQRSHHRRAMERPTPRSVLGDFDGSRFVHSGVESRFSMRDGRYFVATEDAAGGRAEFQVAYTLGFYPLQQYLVEFPDGRLQALGVAWDSRPRAEGGQRWYHLFAGERIPHDDLLHWTGAFFNFNARCASCHVTDLAKNYSREANRYDTGWTEIGVGCEACHGPGSRHVAWARGGAPGGDDGLQRDLARAWSPVDGELRIPPQPAAGLGGQLDACFGCHARREELQPPDPAAGFLENYSLSPLFEGLYHADGQILDEVYEAGSFLQSRMHANQVSCTNCHDPHTDRVRLDGNGLCTQCHAAATFDAREHFFHAPGSAGAQCVDCHMPVTTYMGVDRRRDHSFRVPDPVASVALGVPNACTQCHAGEGARWAADFITSRNGRTAPRYAHAAPLAAARAGTASAAPALVALAQDPAQPPVLRGIALHESARFPSQAHLGAASAGLAARDPLVRASAAAALDFLDPLSRLQYLAPLLDDPVKSVRIAVARHMADLPPAQVPAAMRQSLARVRAELVATLLHNADMPEAMSELGMLHAAAGDLQAAGEALLHARALAPRYLPAMLNLADVFRAQGRDDRGEALLREAIAAYPESGDAHHALGLLYVRSRRMPEALPLLERASRLSPENPRYAFVHAVALVETGNRAAGIAVLEDAARRFPGDARLRDALRAYRGTPPAAGTGR